MTDLVEEAMVLRVIEYATERMKETGKAGKFWEQSCARIKADNEKTASQKIELLTGIAGTARPDQGDWDEVRAKVQATQPKGEVAAPAPAKPPNTPGVVAPAAGDPQPVNPAADPDDKTRSYPSGGPLTIDAPPLDEMHPGAEFGSQRKSNRTRVRRDTGEVANEWGIQSNEWW